MPLPENCRVCSFQRLEHCHRHAPGPSEVSIPQPTHWPRIHLTDRCGQGDTEKEMTFCGQCIHWVSPPRPPGHVHTIPPRGKCTYAAPVPHNVASAFPVTWPYTRAEDCCGDGESAVNAAVTPA